MDKKAKRKEGLFAVVSPGMEGICARELLRLKAEEVRPVPGGVEFSGDSDVLYRSNLWLRSAGRILVRMAKMRCTDFPELYRKTVRLPWGRFMRPSTPVRVRAVSRRSRLVHTGRIAETVAEAIRHSLGSSADQAGGGEQLVLIRFEEDNALLSVDSSGELLHRRGYREDVGRAPLRETLAAGVLGLLDWDGSAPLMDPMCGSGTFLIEAALMAGGMAPGARRSFAFMQWPGFRPGRWEILLAEGAGESRLHVPLWGADRHPGAIRAACANAARAGVETMVTFRNEAIGKMHRPVFGPGLILCNPPYGERLGGGSDLVPLYAELGHAWRTRFSGWRCAFLCTDTRLADATGLSPVPIAELDNGGIRVLLFRANL